MSRVNLIQAQTKDSYENAWRMADKSHPEVATLMRAYGKTGQAISFFNERVLKQAGAPSRAAHRETTQQQIQDEMKNSGCPYATAFNRVYPRTDAGKASQTGGSFVNDDLASSKTVGCPVAGPQLKALFRMPIDATQQEFNAAWTGNGEAVAPINPGKIFQGLVTYTQDAKGVDYETSIRLVKGRFPDLWALVVAIGKS